MLERCRNDVRYLTLLNNNLTLLSNVRYLTSFWRLFDVYKIPPIGGILVNVGTMSKGRRKSYIT